MTTEQQDGWVRVQWRGLVRLVDEKRPAENRWRLEKLALGKKQRLALISPRGKVWEVKLKRFLFLRRAGD